MSPIPFRLFLSKCFSTLVGQLIRRAPGLAVDSRLSCSLYRSMHYIQSRAVQTQEADSQSMIIFGPGA